MNATMSLGKSVIRAAVIWGLVFGAVLPAGAQEMAKAQEAAKKTEAAVQVPGTQGQTLKTAESPAPAAEESSGGPQEGIKVHGHWTITVRNEDGSLASRHEFDNALVPTIGDLLLARILNHSSSVGEWLIVMQGGACLNASSQAANCIITQSSSWTDPNTFPNLTLNIPSSGPDTGKLVLVGSAKAARQTVVVTVATFILECDNTFAPASFCAGPKAVAVQRAFTYQAIGNLSIAVVAGQTIDVTVTISFS